MTIGPPCNLAEFTKVTRIFMTWFHIWVFPKIGVPQNGWSIMENPIKMDDFWGTTIFGNIHLFTSRIPIRLPFFVGILGFFC